MCMLFPVVVEFSSRFHTSAGFPMQWSFAGQRLASGGPLSLQNQLQLLLKWEGLKCLLTGP